MSHHRRAFLLFAFITPAILQAAQLGVFEGESDIGTILQAGKTQFAHGAYRVSGGGENMWFAKDDFHFVWKKVSSGDVSLTADIAFPEAGGDNHRKGVLIIRQSLDADSAYADAALHGDGLTSLQYRDASGTVTHEIQANVSAPKRLRIEKRGDRFYLFIGNTQGFDFAGGSVRVALQTPFYVGIGVCAHNKDAMQQAEFTQVALSTMLPDENDSYSTLETVAISSIDARVSYVTHGHIESPEWSPDGTMLTFIANSKRWRIPLKGGAPEAVTEQDAGSGADAMLSPDGKWLAVAGNDAQDSTITTESTVDKAHKLIAKFQGGKAAVSERPWSPDSRRLAFVSYQRF
jgi:TolB protein